MGCLVSVCFYEIYTLTWKYEEYFLKVVEKHVFCAIGGKVNSVDLFYAGFNFVYFVEGNWIMRKFVKTIFIFIE